MRKFRSILSGFILKFRRAIKRHGIIGIFWIVAGRITVLTNNLRPSVSMEIRMREKRAAEFDQCYGVDTAGFIHPTELNINHPNQVHAVSYRGSDPNLFRKAIEALPIDHRRFIFIDFGSGKGRAVLLAKEFSFKKIVGVEFSKELHAIAQDNISRFHSEISKCDNVELICADALAYPLPGDCLVCYFCNPFDATLMAKMISNIHESFSRNPREIFFVYYNAKEGHLLDSFDFFKSIETIGSVRIWQTTLNPAGF
jgi:SAM-dependent methyltransferase